MEKAGRGGTREREVGVPLFLYCADVALGNCSVVQSLHCFLPPPTFPTLLFSFFVFFPSDLTIGPFILSGL